MSCEAGLLLFLEYHGPETANWYRLGLATDNQRPKLDAWLQEHSLMKRFYLATTVSNSEAGKIRQILAEPHWIRLRSTAPETSFAQQYICTVRDAAETHYIHLGLGSETFRFVAQVKSALGHEHSELLEPLLRQLAAFAQQPLSQETYVVDVTKRPPAAVPGTPALDAAYDRIMHNSSLTKRSGWEHDILINSPLYGADYPGGSVSLEI